MSFANFLLRPLIPTWRFFDRMEQRFELRYRFGADAEGLQEWLAPTPPPSRRWHHLWINAEENLALARQGLIDHFIGWLAKNATDPQGFAKTVHYRWLCRSVLLFVRKNQSCPPAVYYQFRILRFDLTNAIPNQEEHFVFESTVEKDVL